MRRKLTLNCDLGEGFGPWKMGDDRDIILVQGHRISKIGLAQIFYSKLTGIAEMDWGTVHGWVAGTNLNGFDRLCRRHGAHAHHHFSPENAGGCAVEVGAEHGDIHALADISDFNARV